jgi:hypothetical protein
MWMMMCGREESVEGSSGPGTVDMAEEFYYSIPRYVVLVRYTYCRSVRPFLWGCATVREDLRGTVLSIE